MFKEIGEFYGSVTINLNHPWRLRLPFVFCFGFLPNSRTGRSILCTTLRVAVNGPLISACRARLSAKNVL